MFLIVFAFNLRFLQQLVIFGVPESIQRFAFLRQDTFPDRWNNVENRILSVKRSQLFAHCLQANQAHNNVFPFFFFRCFLLQQTKMLSRLYVQNNISCTYGGNLLSKHVCDYSPSLIYDSRISRIIQNTINLLIKCVLHFACLCQISAL